MVRIQELSKLEKLTPEAKGCFRGSKIDTMADEMTHIVKPKETLYSISKTYNVSLADLQKENGIQGTTIRIGQVLRIPGKQQNYLAYRIRLERFEETDIYTLGNLIVYGATNFSYWSPVFECKTLELGWNNNENQRSCIPEGIYPLVLEYSKAFKRELWELKQVPGRTEVKIHEGNLTSHLTGCIAVGEKHAEINKDGIPDVVNSKPTLDKFHSVLRDQKYLIIEIVNEIA